MKRVSITAVNADGDQVVGTKGSEKEGAGVGGADSGSGSVCNAHTNTHIHTWRETLMCA